MSPKAILPRSLPSRGMEAKMSELGSTNPFSDRPECFKESRTFNLRSMSIRAIWGRAQTLTLQGVCCSTLNRTG